jgi:4-carboxymuconolactone decarboxylase
MTDHHRHMPILATNRMAAKRLDELRYRTSTGNGRTAQGDDAMSEARSRAQQAMGDIAPALANYTDEVLFGDVWRRPGLSARDRSLITVASLVALYRTNELPTHMKLALQNGVTGDELVEVITHLAFYAGWPTAATAVPIARRVFEEFDAAAPADATPGVR